MRYVFTAIILMLALFIYAPVSPVAIMHVTGVNGAASYDGEPVYIIGLECAIKGNRSRKGAPIYHMPGRPYYAATRAERRFCTESAAKAAGFRKSRAY